MAEEIRALTVRQPWAWALCAGYKDVENRAWSTPYVGLVAIHAGGTMGPSADIEGCKALLGTLDDCAVVPETFTRSAFVGVVRLVDGATRERSSSMWAADGSPFHWRVEGARLFSRPIHASGQTGLWTPSPADVAAIRRLMDAGA